MTTSTEPTHAKQPVSTERADDTFVGRRRELEAISRSLAAVASRGGRLEIVSGAPGIGKTRLTHEVAAIARGRGFYVLRGGCWEGEGAPAYWPWADVLRNHLGAPREDAAGTAIDFSQLLEVAATRAGVPVRGIVDPSKDAQQARFMLFDRFCEFLAATAGGQPVLVIIDDVQSADIGSLLLLQFLAGRLAKLPIVLLVTSREPLSEMTASTSRHAWARHIVLRGLSRSEARALLAARAARTPGRAVLDRLMHLTDGNPYFLKELGQLLVDGEAGFDPTGAVALPASLLVVTLQPYHRLSVGCRSLLQAASVVGREFDAELAARAAGLPIREALGLLDEAVERRVVTAAGAARYHFAHALVREAIHDQLHPSDRTRLHESIAVALERQAEGGERVSAATLAHHFCKALPLTQRRQAALYCIAAGESAHTAFAYEEAVFQLRRAQEISGTSLTELESCDLLLRLGAAEAGAGEWARSRRTFEDAAAVARRINCPERLAHAALGFKGMMWATNPVDSDATTLLEEARLHLGQGYPGLQVELLSALSRSLYFSNETERATSYSDTAMELALSLNDDRLHAIALQAQTFRLLRPGKSVEVLTSATTLVRLADGLRDAELRFNARIFRQFALLSLGRLAEANGELEVAARISDATPHPRFQWQIAVLRVARATLRGNLALADRLSLISLELGTRVHDASPMQYHLLQGFQRAQMRNDLAGLLAVTEMAVERFPNIPAFRIGQALILARSSHTDLALEILHELAADSFSQIPPDTLSLCLLAVLAEVATIVSHKAYERTLYELLLPHASEFIVAAWGTLLDGSVAHYLALLADSLGLQVAACEHFESAIAANRRIGAPALTARSSLHYALHLRSSADESQIEKARALAAGAAGTFLSLNLQEYATQAQQLSDALMAKTALPRETEAAPTLRIGGLNTFRREGDFWMIAYKGSSTLLRATLGLQYIAALLSQPGISVHVLDLVRGRYPHAISGSSTVDLQSDAKARSAYRQRLKDLSLEIETAESNNDLGMRGRLVAERDHLMDELSRSFSISGSPRPYRSDAERARISARNRISSAIRTLRSSIPGCAQFIERSIRTGIVCVYDPIEPIDWEL